MTAMPLCKLLVDICVLCSGVVLLGENTANGKATIRGFENISFWSVHCSASTAFFWPLQWYEWCQEEFLSDIEKARVNDEKLWLEKYQVGDCKV